MPRFASVLVVAMLVSGCVGTASPSAAGLSGPGDAAATPIELTIYGAASLNAALDAVRTAYESVDESVTLVISTDSSAALETKIEQDAPADVFLSADTSNPQKLVDGGFAAGGATAFAGNVLTIIVPTGNPAGITSPADLARPGVKVIAAGDGVPITKYAAELVANLAALPGYPTDFVARYAANVVSKEENVKSVVAKIELGEGDAGIVYVTDAVASTKVMTIAVPASANVPATYAGVVVKASRNQEVARAFLDWLAGPRGQAVLAGYGFRPPVP